MFRKVLIAVVFIFAIAQSASVQENHSISLGIYSDLGGWCLSHGNGVNALNMTLCYTLGTAQGNLLADEVMNEIILLMSRLSERYEMILLENRGYAKLMSANPVGGNPMLATVPAVFDNCTVDIQCPKGYADYPTAAICLTNFVDYCPNEDQTISMLKQEVEKYPCSGNYIDLSGSVDLGKDLFYHRNSKIRLSVEQHFAFDRACLLNGGSYVVGKFRLKCKSLDVMTCHIGVTRVASFVDRAELDRVCGEKKADIVDLRSLSVSHYFDSIIDSFNASVMCLIVDPQQKGEIEALMETVLIEIYVNVTAKKDNDFAGMLSEPDYGHFDDMAVAIFSSRGFIGSGGLVSINRGGIHKRFVITARHVVETHSNVWVCSVRSCVCASVIIPTDTKVDIAFLLVEDIKKGHFTRVLPKKSSGDLSIAGFVQNNAKIDARSFRVGFLGSKVTTGGYSYLLTDHHVAMSEGLSGSAVMISGDVVGVFGGVWSTSYLWSAKENGMVSLLTQELLDFAYDYSVLRKPICSGSGTAFLESYRDSVSSYVAGVLEGSAKKIRGVQED